ncbi:hypothetical protein HK107_14110 [Parvularcula sp. ZS-1/3]|uniref:Uncharacterized protein n=1 Tax=Parvularcula mediterranea TaxID=2732508 RepID=A0A7Y3RNT5_9PROT|nr:hypothetical protein [Parvularcula mediterranea]NNU17463.1 hypothetical protein [Parvularcula mediterranea]
MDGSSFSRLFGDIRFSLASVLAVWMSLSVPLVLIAGGVVFIGGGYAEVLAVALAAALFSAADIFGLLLQVSEEAEEKEELIDEMLALPIPRMARILSGRYL